MKPDSEPVHAGSSGRDRSQGVGSDVRTRLERAGRERLGVRLALVLGFTAVFGLWLAWGYQLLQHLEHIQHNVNDVQESYVRGEQVLVKVRTNVLLGSIYLRDALIDNESSRREYYRSELNRLRDEIEGPLNVYLSDAAPEERGQWARLETELREYWASREMAFTDDAHTPTEAYLLLRKRVVPKRDGVLQIVDQLSDLQSAAHERQQNDTNALYGIVRGRVVLIGAATLVGALFVALFVSQHINRLQHQVERQREGEQQLRRDLERLSARLVDAQEQERREIARELHDAVGQALTAVKMDIGVALRTTLTDRTRAALDEAKEITETTLQGVRDLSQLLHPSTLDDFGLPDTLRTYLNRFSERTGIRGQIVDALPDRLPSDIEACVYRIVQEALNNVARHSGASVCTVSLSIDGGRLRVVVDDNGCGPQGTIGAVNGHGLGLIAMRERAQAQGGSFAIAPLPGGGTRVDVSMAVPPTPHERRQELQAG